MLQKRECPICGRAFTTLDVVLAETDVRFQCPHCWNRVNATGPVTKPAFGTRPPVLARRKIRAGRRKT